MNNRWCSLRTLAIASILCFPHVGSSRCYAADTATEERWIGRLVSSAEQLLTDTSRKDYEQGYVVNITYRTLAEVGRADQAITFVRTHLRQDERSDAFKLIAAQQSYNDDVPGALRTIESISDAMAKEHAFSMVVWRQAQRGDYAEAMTLAERVTDARHRDDTLSGIIHAHLDAGNFDEADQLLEQVKDVEVRQELEDHRDSLRTEIKPSDPDFVERAVAKEKRVWGELFTPEHEQLRRLDCEAKIAIHHGDAAAFHQAMKQIRESIPSWSPKVQRNLWMSCAFLYYEFGERPRAREAFRQVLSSYLESRDVLDLSRIFLSVGSFHDQLTDVMPADEIEEWVGKMIAVDGAHDLIGGLVEVMFKRGDAQFAERMYERLQTPQQRLEVASYVLSALADQKFGRVSQPK